VSPDDNRSLASDLRRESNRAPKELADLLASDAEMLERVAAEVASIRSQAQTFPTVLLYGVLSFISLVGVVIPLAMLIIALDGKAQVTEWTTQTVLLTFFSVGLGLLNAYLWYQLSVLAGLARFAWPRD